MVRAGRFVLAIMLLMTVFASGQTGPATVPVSSPPSSAATRQAFDVKAAVEGYLAKMPPARRARSNAYFEGGYSLILWDFLSTVLVMWLLLHFRWSAAMRGLAARITRFRPLQTGLLGRGRPGAAHQAAEPCNSGSRAEKHHDPRESGLHRGGCWPAGLPNRSSPNASTERYTVPSAARDCR